MLTWLSSILKGLVKSGLKFLSSFVKDPKKIIKELLDFRKRGESIARRQRANVTRVTNRHLTLKILKRVRRVKKTDAVLQQMVDDLDSSVKPVNSDPKNQPVKIKVRSSWISYLEDDKKPNKWWVETIKNKKFQIKAKDSQIFKAINSNSPGKVINRIMKGKKW